MKRNMIIGLILILASCRPAIKGGEAMPSFNLLLLDSVTQFNTQQIPEGKPIALLYFSPDCEHCQKETKGIIQKMDSLNQVEFYFITNDPFERLQVYNHAYKLYKYSNIILGRDYDFAFIRHFKEAAPPYLVIYDQYKKERAVFIGEYPTSQLIAFINTL